MNKFAIAIAATLVATPALAQYAGPQVYGEVYMRQAPAPYGAYAYFPDSTYAQGGPFGFYGQVYSRERDIATEPDPDIRLQLRREENLNSGLYPQ